MKKTLFAAALLLAASASALAQNTMNIAYFDGSTLLIDMDDVETVTFTYETPGTQQSVDLGLSVNWATCNVGAESPEQIGYRYAWGETMPSNQYGPAGSRWWALPSSALTDKGVTDADLNLMPGFDAAQHHWHGDWRMPTKAEIEELVNSCEWEYTRVSNVYGFEVTAPNGQSIFIPTAIAAGGEDLNLAPSLFWASSTKATSPYEAYVLAKSNDSAAVVSQGRYLGNAVRAVCPPDLNSRYPNTIYIIGDATPNGWDMAGTALRKVEPGVYEYEGTLTLGTFKVFVTSPCDWGDKFYRPMSDGLSITKGGLSNSPIQFATQAAVGDLKWSVTEASDYYRLTFDLRNMTLNVVDNSPAPAVQPLVDTETLYMVGNATGAQWTIANGVQLPLTDADNYVFTWTGYLFNGEMKILTSLTQDWSDSFVRPTVDATEISSAGLTDSPIGYFSETGYNNGDYKWKITDEGFYTLTVDLANKTISATYIGSPINELMIVGDATTAGWTLDAACEFYQEPAGSKIFVWAGDLTEGELKATGSRSWEVPFVRPTASAVQISHSGAAASNFTYTNSPDHKWNVTEPGRYRLTFDLPRGTFKAEYLGETIHKYKAPLYWSVYEYCFKEEKKGNSDINITSKMWDNYLDWVAENLKPAGYDMVCTDGFVPMLAVDGCAYMNKYGDVMLSDLVQRCRARGLKLGVYDNPLWIHGDDNTLIPGTDRTLGSLKYDSSTDHVLHPDEPWDKWFQWAVASHPGAKEFIDGFFKHYKELGVEYIRMDFLSWYEDGYDRGFDWENNGIVGRGYGRDNYIRALQYVAESAEKYGIFVSLVMPHLYHEANVERHTGHMTRIVADTQYGGWFHTSEDGAGHYYPNWANYKNQFDGFTLWSKVTGRHDIIADGDFIIIHNYSTPAEKQTAISLQVVACGPITPADQPSTIGTDNLQYYVNPEVLALNADRFVGKPHPTVPNVWTGQMSNGDWIVAYFNRSNDWQNPTIDFAELGLQGDWNVRDLWGRADKGAKSSYTDWVQDHGCRLLRLSPAN